MREDVLRKIAAWLCVSAPRVALGSALKYLVLVLLLGHGVAQAAFPAKVVWRFNEFPSIDYTNPGIACFNFLTPRPSRAVITGVNDAQCWDDTPPTPYIAATLHTWYACPAFSSAVNSSDCECNQGFVESGDICVSPDFPLGCPFPNSVFGACGGPVPVLPKYLPPGTPVGGGPGINIGVVSSAIPKVKLRDGDPFCEECGSGMQGAGSGPIAGSDPTVVLGLVTISGIYDPGPPAATGPLHTGFSTAGAGGYGSGGETVGGTGEATCSAAQAGDPIAVATGNHFEQEVDYAGAAGLSFVRNYSSALPGWTHNWGLALVFDAAAARVIRTDGRSYVFLKNSVGTWVPEAGAGGRLVRLATAATGRQAQWHYFADSGHLEEYDAQGRFVRLLDRGNRAVFSAEFTDTKLTRISHRSGRSLQFGYDGSGRLASVTAPDGTVRRYGYDSSNRLVSIQYPDNTTKQYLYENSTYPLALTGVIDQRGVRYATWTYDSQGRATSSENAGGVGRTTLAFNADGTVAVTDALGTTRIQRYATVGAKKLFAGQNIPCVSCEDDAATAVYNAAALLTESTDFLGVATRFTWDAERRLPAATTYAAGRPEEKTVRTEWHPTLDLPTQVVEAGRTRSYTYDANGKRLTETITGGAGGEARTWSWTYTAEGLVASMTDPKGSQWRYTYDALGNRTRIVNPIGHETRFTYDVNGRVTSQTAPNGVQTAFTYDVMGRLTRADWLSQFVAYTYTAVGDLATLQTSEGHAVAFTYDAARRLTLVQDNRGSSIQYTLNAMGNRVREEVRDPGGAIASLVSRSFNAINQVASITGAAGQTTALAYDANGSFVGRTSPLNQTVRQTIDALKRPTVTTFADESVARQSWNALDQIASVTDPKGVQTAYTVSAFGEVTQETSPDSGTVRWQYNLAGERVGQQDARNQSSQIERDSLGRPIRIESGPHHQVALTWDTGVTGYLTGVTDPSGSTTYERDAQGRVVTKTQRVNDDPANPGSYAVTYSHTNGQLSGITYPSGLKITYVRDSNGLITGITTQEPGRNKPVTPWLTNLVHTPLGQPKAWQWSSGDAASRSFDTDGRMSKSELASYTFDAASRITGIDQHLWASRTVTHTVGTATSTVTELYTTTLSWQAGYDRRDRLTSFVRDGAEERFTYDANGNRVSALSIITRDTDLDGEYEDEDFTLITTRHSNLDAASNKLLGFTQTVVKTVEGRTRSAVTTPVAFRLDAAGNLTSDGLREFDYGPTNRLEKARAFKDGEEATISYLTNAFGQRVFKGEPRASQTLPNQSELGEDFITWLRRNFGWLFLQSQRNASLGTAFVFGDGLIPAWAVLGEYDNGSSKGAGRTEFIWLPTEGGNAIPVGMYRNGQFFAIHSDHLGTPRLVTNEQNKPVWQWPYSAFGDNKPTGVLKATPRPRQAITNEPMLLKTTSATEMNLRFPGQYEDKDLKQLYNLHRNYLAGQGRYTQGDPIGLKGGLNRYAYASTNPLGRRDAEGLSDRDREGRDRDARPPGRNIGPTPLGPTYFQRFEQCMSQCEAEGARGCWAAGFFGACLGAGRGPTGALLLGTWMGGSCFVMVRQSCSSSCNASVR